MVPSPSSTKVPLVLAVNAGSSSLKAALIQEEESHLASFVGERLTTDQAVLHTTYDNKTTDKEIPQCDHARVLKHILDFLKGQHLIDNLVATGHRVVHGGERFTESVLIDDQILLEIEDVSYLAPLHNPHNIKGIKALKIAMPSLPAVAVFDTSFHTTLPPMASTYPIPKAYREKGIKKYGFHGTSVRYVVQKAVDIVHSKNPTSAPNLIVCHLGNGASVTAVSNNKSLETSMGFSPLAGLMMGTRSGDIDPAVVSFAVHTLGLDVDRVLQDLNKESGLKAMVETHSPDMRDITCAAKDGDDQAQLAVDMFVYRLVQHIASCLVSLPGPVDAIVFTGGIGEHSHAVRRACVDKLNRTVLPGLKLDQKANESDGAKSDGIVSGSSSFPLCLVIETDEEKMIAKDCFRLVPSSK